MYETNRTPVSLQNGIDAQLANDRLAGLVLVVEDDPDIQSMVADHLIELGFDVCVAPNGEIAMQLIRERRPDVVCLDLNLPRISGYDVCEQIRADPAIKHISILITSARNSFDVRVFSLEAGADAYLTKPYGMKQLTNEIERLFESRPLDIARGTVSASAVGSSACVG